MDRIDVLGEDYKAYNKLTKDLLAETDDAELQAIVENAAAELNSPIALVSLVLDQIQYFKAHVGLPEVLVASRSTHRDASFCQFVVRDGQPFEVNDGANDARVPQHVVKEYGVQSYLGMPIKLGEDVVGSLCIIDTKVRNFSEQERQSLEKLAVLVSDRLEEIATSRRKVRLDLTYTALSPAITELSDAIAPMEEQLGTIYSNMASIRSFLNLHGKLYSHNSAYANIARMSYEGANKAMTKLQTRFEKMENNIVDGLGYLNAMQNLVASSSQTNLSEIITSAKDLTRKDTAAVGGLVLPESLSQKAVYTKAELAIALVSNCLLLLVSQLRNTATPKGIQLNLEEQQEEVKGIFAAEGLEKEAFEAVSNHLNLLIGAHHPTVAIEASEEGIQLVFKIVK